MNNCHVIMLIFFSSSVSLMLIRTTKKKIQLSQTTPCVLGFCLRLSPFSITRLLTRFLASVGRNSHDVHTGKLCCLLHPTLRWLISFSHSPTVTYGGKSYRWDRDVTSWHQGWDTHLTAGSRANCSWGGIIVIDYVNERVKINVLMWDYSFSELMGI